MQRLIYFSIYSFLIILFCGSLKSIGQGNTLSQYRLARQYYDTALVKVKEGDFTRAIKLLDKTIALDSMDSEYYRYRGYSKYKNGYVNYAIRDYDKAILLNPNNINAYIKRGDAFYYKKNFLKSKADYDRAVELDSLNFYALDIRAAVKFNLNDFEGALKDYEKCKKINGGNANLFFNKGTTLFHLGKYNESIYSLDLGIKLDSLIDNINSYVWRGDAKAELGNIEGALLDYNKAIRLNPKQASCYYWKGDVYFKFKKYKEAILEYDKAIQLSANYELAYLERGRAKSFLSKNKEALSDFNKAIEIKGVKVHETYYRRARLKDKMGQPIDSVLADLNSAIKLNDQMINAYEERVRLNFEKENYAFVVKDYKHLQKINPNNPYNYTGMAYTLLMMKDTISAIEMSKRALELFPKDPLSYCSRGTILSEINSKKYESQILDNYNKSIELNSEYGETYYYRAKFKYKMGDKTGACQDMTKAKELSYNQATKEEVKIYCK